MKTSRLSVQIAAIVGAVSASFASLAAVVDSGVINIPIPQNVQGIYYNVVTSAGGTTGGGVAGWDINIYEGSAATGLTFFWPTGSAVSGGGVATGSVYQSLAAGAIVGPASTFSQASGGGGAVNFVNFITAGPKTLGIRFLNEAGAGTHFGYINMTTSGPLGFPTVITRIVYDNVAATPVTVAGGGGGTTIVAGTAPGAVTIPPRTLPTASATSTLSFTASAASSTTCVATGAGYSVSPSPLTLPAATAASVTVTQNSTTAGTYAGTITCTNAAGATPASFVYNFTHVVNAAQVVAAPVIPVPTLNIWGSFALLAGLGLFGAFAVRRFS